MWRARVLRRPHRVQAVDSVSIWAPSLVGLRSALDHPQARAAAGRLSTGKICLKSPYTRRFRGFTREMT